MTIRSLCAILILSCICCQAGPAVVADATNVVVCGTGITQIVTGTNAYWMVLSNTGTNDVDVSIADTGDCTRRVTTIIPGRQYIRRSDGTTNTTPATTNTACCHREISMTLLAGTDTQRMPVHPHLGLNIRVDQPAGSANQVIATLIGPLHTLQGPARQRYLESH